jgi:hypothetical protein
MNEWQGVDCASKQRRSCVKDTTELPSRKLLTKPMSAEQPSMPLLRQGRSALGRLRGVSRGVESGTTNKLIQTGRGAGWSLTFSLAMFDHACAHRDVYRAMVGGRGGILAIHEIRRVLSELVKEELSVFQDDEAVSRELALHCYREFVPHRSDLVPRKKAKIDAVSARRDVPPFSDQWHRAVDWRCGSPLAESPCFYISPQWPVGGSKKPLKT